MKLLTLSRNITHSNFKWNYLVINFSVWFAGEMIELLEMKNDILLSNSK